MLAIQGPATYYEVLGETSSFFVDSCVAFTYFDGVRTRRAVMPGFCVTIFVWLILLQSSSFP